MTDEQERDPRWRVHGSRNLYANRLIRLDMADVETPDGERFEHHTVRMPPVAMTVLLNDDRTHVLLLWRHRFVADIWSWELPGRLVDEEESPAEAAAREIIEQTGYRARSLEDAVTFEPMIGMVDCPHFIFIGAGADQVAEPIKANQVQRMEWVPLAAIPGLIAAGQIKDSGTLIAVLYVLARSGAEDWPISAEHLAWSRWLSD